VEKVWKNKFSLVKNVPVIYVNFVTTVVIVPQKKIRAITFVLPLVQTHTHTHTHTHNMVNMTQLLPVCTYCLACLKRTSSGHTSLQKKLGNTPLELCTAS
jgi:hypothetical protein